MSIELGVLLEPDVDDRSRGRNRALELASAAEANGLDLVVVAQDRSPAAAALDPWTTAVWLAARTERITRAKTHVARQRPEKPRGAAPTRLARPHGNPLDAQASDTRIQVWPCRSGAICNWK